MRVPAALFVAPLGFLAFSHAGAAPLGSVDCIVSGWDENQSIQIFEALNSNDDSNIVSQKGKAEFLTKSQQCSKKFHWSKAAKEEAIGFTSTELLVKVAAGNIRRLGGNVSALDRHFASNRSEYIRRVDTRQYDMASISPALKSAGFDIQNTKAFELVPVYFAFVALREQSRDRFLTLK